MIDFLSDLKKLGITLPEILLPSEDVDLSKWPVVACDQFTSEPEYWDDVSNIVGSNPSTLNLILPECYLEEKSVNERISGIHKTMGKYLDTGVFVKAPFGAQIVVRRPPGKPHRTGLMMNIDLEFYDYSLQSTTPIRPTEGTIVERIPPRKRVRSQAAIELPHVMVLLDDPGSTVIEPLAEGASKATSVYSIPLMKNGGTLEAFRIADPGKLKQMADTLSKLADKGVFKSRYNSDNPFFIAIGDGNHSLAAAKAHWEDVKAAIPAGKRQDHPARYAMVEIVNLYDAGITFEPIHRLFFDVDPVVLLDHFRDNAEVQFTNLGGQISQAIEPGAQDVGLISKEMKGIMHFKTAGASETTATTQRFIDSFLSASNCRIDFVHDLDTAVELGVEPRNSCFVMPKICKTEFFRFIVRNGCYPRKSFSMGESSEKRYYMEARKIKI